MKQWVEKFYADKDRKIIERTLKNVQKEIGGGIVYLECENKPKLLDFYCDEHNSFKILKKPCLDIFKLKLLINKYSLVFFFNKVFL